MIRHAEKADAAAIAAIYEWYVHNTAITFETVAPDAIEMENRIVSYSRNYPYLVWEENGTVTATVTVCNTGSTAAEETVQLYVHDKVASRARPVRELKAFAKVWLEASEAKTVTLSFAADTLGFYDIAMNYVVEPGDFDIWVGHDSTADLHTVLTLK